MNVFRTYVKRNLKENRLRTVMTIIGIILSMALVTAVIEGGYSGLQYLRDVIRKTNGNYHGYFYNIDEYDISDLEQCSEIESFSVYSTLGWADINTTNEAKPYLLIKEGSPDLKDFLNIQILSGRMPENENEILISEHLDYNGNVKLNIGDTITLKLGDRVYDSDSSAGNSYSVSNKQIPIRGDNTAHRKGEYLLPKGKDSERTYTVCGIMPRLSYEIEDFECPGYTAITVSKEGSVSEATSIGVFFKLTDPSAFNEFITNFKKEHPSVSVVKNRELVALYGGTTDRTYIVFIYGLIAVLISLILFGTIALIYNSFSISVSERTKQIGILKSTGATKKQIRKTIFYEALFECGIAIPLGLLLGCLGIGGTLYLLQEGFKSFISSYGGYSGAEYIDIQLVINIPLLVVAVILVILTTFVSAVIPALRASGISPLDSIRQSRDINTDSKIRTSKLLSKLFGVEGMLASKNYIRNRKRYRTTIVSLALSIILFIAASSFSSYLSEATDDEFYIGNMSLVYFFGLSDDENNNTDPAEAERIIRTADEVTDVVRIKELYNMEYLSFSNSKGESAELYNYYSDPSDESNPDDFEKDLYEYEPYISADIVFMEDESFNRLLSSESVSYDPTSDKPQGIVYNYGVINTYDIERNHLTINYSLVNEQDLPLEGSVKFSSAPYEYDGKYLLYETVDKNDDIYIAYMESEAMDSFYDMLSEKYEITENALKSALNLFLYGPDDPASAFPEGLSDEELTIIKGSTTFLLKSEYEESFDFTLIGTTNNQNYLFSSIPTIFLPYSALDRIDVSTSGALSDEEFYIYSNNSSVSEQDIGRILTENGMDSSLLYNYDRSKENTRFIRRMINIFSFGFVLLISLVSIANVFNTISTNVALRRREFGMLKSMGLSNRGITKMLNVECLIYGLRSILLGLPIAFLATFAIYKITNRAFYTEFYIPWYSILIAVAAVMLVVFITMMYAAKKIKKDNTIDAIRNENI